MAGAGVEAPSSKPRYQTFLMTGDAIIRTNITPTKDYSEDAAISSTPGLISSSPQRTPAGSNGDCINRNSSHQHTPRSAQTHSLDNEIAASTPQSPSKEPPYSGGDIAEDNRRASFPSFIGISGKTIGTLEEDNLQEDSFTKPSTSLSPSKPEPSSEDMAAARLAKRLFHLQGFRKADVFRHLIKNNEFTFMVASEYLRCYDFSELSLLESLRKFLTQLVLCGETQERERVLSHFVTRFLECNPNFKKVVAEDPCHTLTCAIMLLNTDLHGQNMNKKMSFSDFCKNLSCLNDGTDFPKELLRSIHKSIARTPLVWATDDHEEIATDDIKVVIRQPSVPALPTHPQKEILRGHVLIKQLKLRGGAQNPWGKRSWKKRLISLQDLNVFICKNEKELEAGGPFKHELPVTHSFSIIPSASRRKDRKKHMFHFISTEGSEFMIQVTNSEMLHDWVRRFNLTAALASAPQLSAAVGSQTQFRKPLRPTSRTTLAMADQVSSHENQLKETRGSLQTISDLPKKGQSKTSLEYTKNQTEFLVIEEMRYKEYVRLLTAEQDPFAESAIEMEK